MARFLALDWDHHQLQIVAAVVRGGQVRVERAAVWQEEATPNLAEAEAQGRRLRDRLKAAGIAPAAVLACVARDRVILKDVRHPPVQAAEEPGVVRFQAVKELTDAPEEAVIDYTPAGEAGNGARRALVLVARRELLAAYQALCRAAGLKLVALTPRPFGALACLPGSVPGPAKKAGPVGPPEAVAVLTATDCWAELAVARGDRLLLARALPAGDSLAAEVRRSLAVFSAQAPGQAVRALYLAGGGDGEALQERLRMLLGVPVHALDPFAGLEGTAPTVPDRGPFAAAVGVLRTQAAGRPLPVNFVQPKEPKPPTDPNKRQTAVAASVAALLLVGVLVFCYVRLASRDREQQALALTKLSLDGQLAQLEEDAQRIQALNEWTESNIVWLDELYDLTDVFPDLNAVRLTRFTGKPRPRATKEKSVAQMVLEGVSTAPDPVDALNDALSKDPHYQVGPKKMDPNTGQDHDQFLGQFTTQLEVEKVPPTRYTRQLVAPPPGQLLAAPRLVPRPAPVGPQPGPTMVNPERPAAPPAAPPGQGPIPSAVQAGAAAPNGQIPGATPGQAPVPVMAQPSPPVPQASTPAPTQETPSAPRARTTRAPRVKGDNQ